MMTDRDRYLFITPVNRSAQKRKIDVSDISSMGQDDINPNHTNIVFADGTLLSVEESIEEIKQILESQNL